MNQATEMEIRFTQSPAETARMDTAALRANFLVPGLMKPGEITLTYSHYDRVIVGGAMPVGGAIVLPLPEELKAAHFLERREMGIINVGGRGHVVTDKGSYGLDKLECAYLGRGTKDVSFMSDHADDPAMFFLMSTPAHQAYPSRMMTKSEAAPVSLGDASTSNRRTIYKYIHLDGIASCQLVMGLTVLEPGSVWNSVPPHTHTRRMEVYFYFDIHPDHRVMHFMGQPQETRHLVMGDREAVISPPWSMHFGVGTANYGFIWAMAGENQEFTDMDPQPIATLR
jgi:4-deoxy-L-threo-5-hexosulose-uronate ketol-isomerase